MAEAANLGGPPPTHPSSDRLGVEHDPHGSTVLTLNSTQDQPPAIPAAIRRNLAGVKRIVDVSAGRFGLIHELRASRDVAYDHVSPEELVDVPIGPDMLLVGVIAEGHLGEAWDDALKRRALYHWIDHPSLEREVAIVRLRVPEASERLATEAAAFVRGLRALDLAKTPGVAETIDWAQALAALGADELDAAIVETTLGSVLKVPEDLRAVRDGQLAELVAQSRSGA